jgi:hypothetical protein
VRRDAFALLALTDAPFRSHGQRHGLGTMVYADGSLYRGTWRENKKVQRRCLPLT